MKNTLIILLLLLSNSVLFADDKIKLGFDIYKNKAACGTCHTLKSAESSGNIGPNLNQIMPTKDRVLAAVTHGIGVMPAYEGILTSEEIDAVSHYVSEVATQ